MPSNKISWTTLKALKIAKGLPFQYTIDDQLNYIVYVVDSSFVLYALIHNTTPRNSDQVDFEDNYLSGANGKILNYDVGATGSAVPSYADLIGGKDPSGFLQPLAVDNSGRLITTAVTAFNSNFAFGDVVTSAIAKTVIRRTAYTEQTTNARRSLVSANVNDSAAGTGARTVLIKYLDQTGAGPFTETVTMNGTTPVNTVNTNICFIEDISVVTAGSGGANAGIISLKAAAAGGGATIGTMAAGDNQTFWSHHYIAVGKECNITGISCGSTSTVVGGGGLFIVTSKPVNSANAVESQVSDFVRLYGQSSTFSRVYQSPIKVVGPARLTMYVTPETATTTTYRSAIDFFEP